MIDLNGIQLRNRLVTSSSLLGYGAPKGFVHLGIRQGSPRVRWDY